MKIHEVNGVSSAAHSDAVLETSFKPRAGTPVLTIGKYLF